MPILVANKYFVDILPLKGLIESHHDFDTAQISKTLTRHSPMKPYCSKMLKII